MKGLSRQKDQSDSWIFIVGLTIAPHMLDKVGNIASSHSMD